MDKILVASVFIGLISCLSLVAIAMVILWKFDLLIIPFNFLLFVCFYIYIFEKEITDHI